jgi:hypothetical protein
MVILCLAGAVLNIAVNMVSHKIVSFPLYLDTILTVAVTLLGGLFWGALTGGLTNIIFQTIWFWGWEPYLYAICNIVTACITWQFIRFFPKELRIQHVPGETPIKSAKAFYRTSHDVSRLRTVMGRVIVLVMLSFVLCFAMSILGGIITVIVKFFISIRLDGAVFNPASALMSPMFSEEVHIILAEILARIPVNVVDRLITAFAGYGIALGLSRIKWMHSL